MLLFLWLECDMCGEKAISIIADGAHSMNHIESLFEILKLTQVKKTKLVLQLITASFYLVFLLLDST